MRTQKEIQQRAPLWSAILLILNLVMMSYDARDEVTKQRMIRVWAGAAAAPFQNAAALIGNTVFGFFYQLNDLRRASSENEVLRKRVAEIEAKLHETQAAANENERLRGLLGLQEKKDYEAIAASVIARDPSAWFNMVTIDRGRMSGVENGMPVVTAEGIVGRVVATSPVTALVMLITDERTGAGAVVGQLGQSTALGSVRGLGERGLLKMSYVSGLEEVSEKDSVWTTGQDSVYPPGLKIGEVAKVKKSGSTSQQEIEVLPSARLDSLKQVAVLRYRPQEHPPYDQKLPNIGKGKK